LFGNFSNILKEIAQGIKSFQNILKKQLRLYKNIHMAHSNFKQRHRFTSTWLFAAGMSALTAFIIGLIFYLTEAHPGILYDTLKLLCLQDHDLDHLVMKIDDLEHKIQSLEHKIQSLEHKIEVLTADVLTTDTISSGISMFLLHVLISTLKNR
jgi:peptidoglycan hydrolase CwlO-like protein